MALWGIPLILILSYQGGFYFLLLVLLINGMSLWEFYTIFRTQNLHAYRITGVVSSTFLILTVFYASYDAIVAMSFLLLIVIFIQHLKISQPSATVNTFFTISGIFYISFFLAALLILRQELDSWMGFSEGTNAGGRYLILLWMAVWFCDTAAYFGGRLLGKHKLAPLTSPNKTIEGAISGLIGAFLIFVALGPFIVRELPAEYFWISGAIVGIFGQAGDLVESRFKRDAGVKDTSTVLPGHGGFLDRFDSVIFVSPLLFLVFYYLRP